MMVLSGAARIYLYRGATDMRRSFDGLAGMVTGCLGDDPLSGAVYVFCNRRRNRIKLLYWSGDGYAIWAKRLERGTFLMPAATTTRVELSSAQLSMLLEGIVPLRVGVRYRRPPVPAGMLAAAAGSE